jgi:diguanylate cyclase (GGDEF)-like protein
MAEPPGDTPDADIAEVVESWRESCRQDQLVMRGNLPNTRSELPQALLEASREDTVPDLRVRQEAQNLSIGASIDSALRQLFLLGRILSNESYELEAGRLVGSLGAAAEAIALQHVETVQRQALTDDLTGIGNRRGFKRDFDGALRRVSSAAGSFALAMVDLDGLKVVNDENGGHLAGNEYIRLFSRHLQDFVRPDRGRVFRYGGDEFVVIFRDLNRASAEEILARLRADPAVPPFCYGVSECPTDAQEEDRLLAIADDERLYEMKDAAGKEARTARAREWLDSEFWNFVPPNQR